MKAKSGRRKLLVVDERGFDKYCNDPTKDESPGIWGRRPNARLLPDPVPPTDVPDRVGAPEGLRFERVQTPDNLAVWNTLMAHEHPQGVTKFAEGPEEIPIQQ